MNSTQIQCLVTQSEFGANQNSWASSELQLAPGAHQLLYFESITTGLIWNHTFQARLRDYAILFSTFWIGWCLPKAPTYLVRYFYILQLLYGLHHRDKTVAWNRTAVPQLLKYMHVKWVEVKTEYNDSVITFASLMSFRTMKNDDKNTRKFVYEITLNATQILTINGRINNINGIQISKRWQI